MSKENDFDYKVLKLHGQAEKNKLMAIIAV